MYMEEYYYKEIWFELRKYLYTKKGTRYLITKTPIKNNQLHGNTTFYFENGQVNQGEFWTWKHGILKSIHRFYPNGRPMIYAEFDQEPILRHGKRLDYHRNGQLAKEAFFQYDYLEGTYQEFDKKGRLILKARLRKGLEIDTTRIYKRGRLRAMYLPNRDGLYYAKLVYAPNGRLKKYRFLDYGDQDIWPKTMQYWWAKDVLDSLQQGLLNQFNASGKRHLHWKTLNPQWNRYEVGIFNNGVLQGPFYWYRIDKITTLFKGHMKDGKLEGWALGYPKLQDDADSLLYEQGKLIRMKLHQYHLQVTFKDGLPDGTYSHIDRFRGYVVKAYLSKGKFQGKIRVFNHQNKLRFEGTVKDNQWTRDTIRVYNAQGHCIKGYLYQDKMTMQEFIYSPDGSVKDNGAQLIDNDTVFDIGFVRSDLVKIKLPIIKVLSQFYLPDKRWNE